MYQFPYIRMYFCCHGTKRIWLIHHFRGGVWAWQTSTTCIFRTHLLLCYCIEWGFLTNFSIRYYGMAITVWFAPGNVFSSIHFSCTWVKVNYSVSKRLKPPLVEDWVHLMLLAYVFTNVFWYCKPPNKWKSGGKISEFLHCLLVQISWAFVEMKLWGQPWMPFSRTQELKIYLPS